MTARVVAAFDFDGTLTEGDNVVPFMRRVAGLRRLLVRSFARAPRILAALARRDRDRLKATMTDVVFAGIDEAAIAAEAAEFADEIVKRRLRVDTFERLHWHLAHGHTVVIVSASYEVYLGVVAERLGLHAAVGTRLELGPDGRYTGRLEGANCRAAEKLRRLDEWLAGQGLRRDEITLWVYGDSEGDRQLLEAADHPIWAKHPIDSVAASR
jgi:phosphatidylglycerophosphatase C